jgi:hypothetical protein
MSDDGPIGPKHVALNVLLMIIIDVLDPLCGLVVRVYGYRYKSPGFDSRRYQIF